MSWTAYRLVFRLRSPLHIGWRKVGNLMQTRPYVTGKVLWGALTARLTRDTRPGATADDYRQVGDQVNEALAFTYLFPALTPDPSQALYPWYTERGLAYGAEKMPAAQFDHLFLDSYAGTALDYDRFGAEPGSLRETEFIAPHTREGTPVYLVGHILAQDGGPDGWQEALGAVQLGGERKYGWGRVELVDGPHPLPHGERLFGQFELIAGNKVPVLQAIQDMPVLAHALAVEFNGHKPVSDLRGPVEPLVGRETRVEKKKGFGAHLPQARICWQAGCVIGAGRSIVIGSYGIWEATR